MKHRLKILGFMLLVVLMAPAMFADNVTIVADTSQAAESLKMVADNCTNELLAPQVTAGVTSMPVVVTGMQFNRINTSENNGTNFLDSTTTVANEITSANNQSADNSSNNSGVMYPASQAATVDTSQSNQMVQSDANVASMNQVAFDSSGNFNFTANTFDNSNRVANETAFKQARIELQSIVGAKKKSF
jgi:hypothetical protein